jgi:hypothetical protein
MILLTHERLWGGLRAVKASLKIVVNYLVNCAKISKKASPATNCHLPERRNTVAKMVTIERNALNTRGELAKIAFSQV